MIKHHINGDIITAFKTNNYDFLVHGCNCFCTMGAGVAKQIAVNFPEALEVDLRTVKGDIDKLGNYTSAVTDYGTIINLYTQYNYGRGSLVNYSNVINLHTQDNQCQDLLVDYDAVEYGFKLLNDNLPLGSEILIPKIGAGLGKGDWSIIESVINSSTDNLNLTLITL